MWCPASPAVLFLIGCIPTAADDDAGDDDDTPLTPPETVTVNWRMARPMAAPYDKVKVRAVTTERPACSKVFDCTAGTGTIELMPIQVINR